MHVENICLFQQKTKTNFNIKPWKMFFFFKCFFEANTQNRVTKQNCDPTFKNPQNTSKLLQNDSTIIKMKLQLHIHI
jgi:hypothetical protein